MNRGKTVVPDFSTTVREFTKWIDDMDFRLLTAMLDEARLGNRVDGSWTTQAYNNIVEALRQTGLTGITKNNVKNRQKSLKDRWREVHDLFSGLSGFAWDESMKRFTTEPEVWHELLQAKPAAAKWRVSSIRYYDLMEELWGVDRATGHMARTARQARRNIGMPSVTVDLNDDVDNIPQDDPFQAGFDIAYRSPPHYGSYSPVDVSSAASGGTTGTSSSRDTKRKAPMIDVMDAQFDRALKNNILINWPHYIMQHMVKCKDNGMPLPYPILISHILAAYGVDLGIDVAVELGWAPFFNKNTLKKLNVVNVNGVWIHDRDNHQHGQNIEDEDHAMPEDHGEEQPADITQQPPVQYDSQMFSQILTGIQGLQEGLNNLTINVNQIHNRLDTLEHKFDDFQSSFE
uniref:Myb/SANT-like domain-containing protein n=1 Tax=Cajanus cajan TaxID=3821 RepID=A0A151SKY8_CAJCA|nr:hypothetical protein KK1_001670 [Cajanus cajan]